MIFALYDKFKLKDGRVGWIIEVFNNGESIMFEIDKKGIDDRIVDITLDDLAEKL